jgi:hypothetical protein
MTKRRFSQLGVSLSGLLFWSVLIGGAALVGMKLFPLYNEKMKVDLALEKVATDPQVADWSKAEIVKAVMRQFEVSDVDRWSEVEFNREIVVERNSEGRRMALFYEIRGPLCCDLDVVLNYDREFQLPRGSNDY